MDGIAIRVDSLGKAYQIRHGAEVRDRRLSEMLTDEFQRWFRRGGDRQSTLETFWALRDLSFEVREGEVLGIIGRNGAGKSTLLKILSRITDPTNGRVEIRGRVASLLEVGTGFHPELTGRENIFLNGAILGMKFGEIRRKFDEIVEFSGVERFLDTPVKRYSSGMYVRLAFAVAAHLEPDILLVDEVLAVGDAEFQKRCLGKMQSIAGGGRTVIFVSHQLPSVVRLCEKALLIEGGQIRTSGKPEEVISVYRGAGTSEAINVHLPPDPKKYVQLTRVAIENDDSANGDLPLSLDRPILVRVRLTAIEPSRELALSFALLTTEGTVVFASNSPNAGADVSFAEPGEREVLLTFPGGQLLNREFVCRIALWSQSDGILDEYETAPVSFVARETQRLPVQLNGLVAGQIGWQVMEPVCQV
ncbi:polysaccharide ABC transporter ATP-binding protein [Limibaculum sp. FT325]|uniref:ABC transporter ATP-binding protein n=1 Tax=Thermohalobaculum sediminis TaxID=2939436 RepID=UPI0020BDC378|nr:polysaccharide ABC transporter ATP-binding protein [Limibaculum sediminis]MCL5776869.1 polysaccharide ABC transporter ATP-binding protein [Limibaculum sediminis]